MGRFGRGAALLLTLAITACSATGLQAANPASKAAERPNIVYVMTDDLAWNLVGLMPHVQELMRNGTTFDRYFLTDSLCCPSRTSFLRGQMPHDTQIFTNTAPDGGFAQFHDRGEEGSTIATWLHGGGYRTALMGKYLNGYLQKNTGVPQTYVPPGWDEWDVAGNGYPEFNYTMNVNGRLVQHGHQPQDYLTDVIAGAGQALVKSSVAQNKPFYLQLATFAPHAPYTPPPRYAGHFPNLTYPRTAAFDEQDLSDKPPWLRSLPPLTPQAMAAIDHDFQLRAEADLAVDDLIAGIEQQLQRTNQLQNTYFVFSSDNGYHMGDHRLHSGKQTAFDTDIRVPLVVRGPGVPAGVTRHEPVMNVDLAPTFAEIAGVKAPDVDGQSLLPLLHSGTSPNWRSTVLIEHHGPNRATADPDRTPRRSEDPPSYEAIRTNTHTYVEYAGGERELYDDGKDPTQLNNMAQSADPQLLQRLHDTLVKLENCHRGSCFV